MRVCGKTWSEYVAFLKGPFILLTVVFVLRWVLSECGIHGPLTKYLSVSAVSIPIVIYLALKTHTRRFGGYAHLGTLVLLVGLWANILISVGILAAWVTGRDNVYSQLEHLGQASGYAAHILTHLTVFTSLFTLEYFFIDALILYLLRRLDT